MKYSLRISLGVFFLASTFYFFVSLVIFRVINVLLFSKLQVSNYFLSFAFAGCLCLMIFFQYTVDPYQIQVDRWSAIHNFLHYFLCGQYPYMAQTHLGGYGSPFPIWQFFHLPFYLFGNVGLSIFFVWAFFTYSIKSYAGNAAALVSIILLVISPAFVYEIVVRSDLVTNFLLVASILIFFYIKKIRLSSHFWMIAATSGLLLSTRFTAVIPLSMYYFYEWYKLPLMRKLLFPIVVIGIFLLTFLPFVLWDIDDLFFFKYNPFMLQSRQIQSADFILFIPLFIYWAYSWRHHESIKICYLKLMKNISYFLIVLIMVTFMHNMVLSGNYLIFSSTYDITYFNMALPYLVMGISIGSR